MKVHRKKQIERSYDCIICFELCKKPITCVRCSQLLCQHHVKLLSNRCPHCRLQPFQFKAQPMIESFIQIEIKKLRETLKKQNVFKCLVEGCQFSGKYPAMVFHRKSKHPYEKIDEILFPEERQKKKMRDAVKKIFLQKYVQKAKKYYQQALVLYIKSKGAIQMAHIDNCSNHRCKDVIIGEKFIGIGQKNQEDLIQTNCMEGKKLRVDF